MAEDLNLERGEQATKFQSFINKTLLKTMDAGNYFTLSSQAISSLNILPKLKADLLPEAQSAGGSSSRSNTTVYALLNRCRTASGQRLLAVWLQHPLILKEKIDLRLDIVQHFVENNELRMLCTDEYMKKIPDLLKTAFKIDREKCNIFDLMKVYDSCKTAQSLCKSFRQTIGISSSIHTPDAVHKLFNWLQTTCDDLKEYKNILEQSIDVQGTNELGEYQVKADSNDDIARISLEISSLCTQAKRELQSVAIDIGLEAEKTIKLETDGEKGFGFKVTKNNEQSVRGNNDYEQLSSVKKDGYRFTNRKLTKLSAKYVQAKEEYNSLAKVIIVDIINGAVLHASEVIEFSVAITVLDVFLGLSIAAVQNNYIRPLICDSKEGRIEIDRLRHPCVESQPDIENYVPNNIIMRKDDKKFYMITGPNMGGKSTFIKSVGVAVIMAQCGSMIAAEDARVSIIDAVFTRLGAGDKQLEGISTFMEEMLDMSVILKGSTENSLVIIDELGRGTSTFDGFGLAWSISKHLAAKTKCYGLFATHLHELTEMEEEVSTVGNLHVKAVCQEDKLTMLYNIGRGVCDESYGIHVAQYTNFPEHVVLDAKEKLRQLEEVPGLEDKKELRAFVRECVDGHLTRTSN